MNLIKTPLEGFLVIEPDFFEDERGFFLETFQKKRYVEAGIDDIFLQDNQSRSSNKVLRGMHFQLEQPQAQIVTVLRGCIYDVAVDIRTESKTFGKWYGVKLSDDQRHRQVYMAPGFAHGFCVLSDYADLHYKVSTSYNPNDEYGILWNDSLIGIEWPISNPIISQRDLGYMGLKEQYNLFK